MTRECAARCASFERHGADRPDSHARQRPRRQRAPHGHGRRTEDARVRRIETAEHPHHRRGHPAGPPGRGPDARAREHDALGGPRRLRAPGRGGRSPPGHHDRTRRRLRRRVRSGRRARAPAAHEDLGARIARRYPAQHAHDGRARARARRARRVRGAEWRRRAVARSARAARADPAACERRASGRGRDPHGPHRRRAAHPRRRARGRAGAPRVRRHHRGAAAAGAFGGSLGRATRRGPCAVACVLHGFGSRDVGAHPAPHRTHARVAQHARPAGRAGQRAARARAGVRSHGLRQVDHARSARARGRHAALGGPVDPRRSDRIRTVGPRPRR